MAEKKRRAKSFKGCTPCKAARRKCPEERPACSHCVKFGIVCQYDLDSVLRFEQFTVVEDKETHRGPKAVQLRPRAGSRRGSEGDASDVVPKLRNDSLFTTSSETIIEVKEEDTPSTPLEAVYPISRMPLAREDTINPLDSRYFHFFLSSMAYILPYTTLFPSIVIDVFARSVPHITLRHSVLSISSMIADYRLQRPMTRFQIQYITSLQKIQHAIQELSLDEGTTIAVFLILWIDVVRAELRSSRKHLRGLYLLLQELQKPYRRPESEPGILVDESGGVGVSPLIMQIWRISIRLDFTTSLYLVQPPVFPPIPTEQQHLHHRWILLSTPDTNAAEWALAAFAQDNLMHRACHVAFRARKLRKSRNYTPEDEAEIQAATAELEKEYQEWHQRRIVQIAETLQQESQFGSPKSSEPSPPDSPSSIGDEQLWTFVNYPRYRVVNPFYANIAIQVRASSIYISLIAHPVIGPGPNRQRFHDAVEICRIIAGLGEDRTNTASSKIWALFLAGVAFGGLRRSKMEAEWLLWKMVAIVKMFPLMKDAVKAYENLWDAEGDFWDEMDKIQAVLY